LHTNSFYAMNAAIQKFETRIVQKYERQVDGRMTAWARCRRCYRFY